MCVKIHVGFVGAWKWLPPKSELRAQCCHLKEVSNGGNAANADTNPVEGLINQTLEAKTDAFIRAAAHDRDEYFSKVPEGCRPKENRDGPDPGSATGIYFSYPFMKLPYWSEDFLVPDSMHTCANEVGCSTLISTSKVVWTPQRGRNVSSFNLRNTSVSQSYFQSKSKCVCVCVWGGGIRAYAFINTLVSIYPWSSAELKV
jgi:hypothetical protein